MRYLFSPMSVLVAAFAVFVLAPVAAFGDTIYFDDGSYVEIPEGQKAIIVPIWVKTNRLIQETPIRAYEPEPTTDDGPGIEAPSCTPAGELSTGAPPCEE
ncbi:MAG: hypothetical protein HRU11_12325 [Parvularculaceae bacterium]|nr:hypothetical protein [Parvularculaceae bacterium]